MPRDAGDQMNSFLEVDLRYGNLNGQMGQPTKNRKSEIDFLIFFPHTVLPHYYCSTSRHFIHILKSAEYSACSIM